MKHLLLIRSSWADPKKSKLRLILTEQYTVPSIWDQSPDFEIQVMLHPDDPYKEKRMELFRRCGKPVEFLEQDLSGQMDNPFDQPCHGWDLPSGRILTTRCDDDDMLSSDFMRLTASAAARCHDDTALLAWPKGYILVLGEPDRLHSHTTRTNRFGSVVSSSGVCTLDMHSVMLNYSMPRHVVSDLPGWVQIRHENNRSRILGKYLRGCQKGPDRGRWAVELPGRDSSGEVRAGSPQYTAEGMTMSRNALDDHHHILPEHDHDHANFRKS